MIKIKTFLRCFIFILVLLLSFSIGYFFGRCRYGGPGYLVPRDKDGFRWLGSAGDREIYVASFMSKDEPNRKNLILKINDDFIYWESDRNSDGKLDNVKHFENGVLMYESEDTNSDGSLNRRMVESYYEDGLHQRVMVDLNADNDFDLRINNPDSDDPVVEIFVEDKWTKRVKKNGVHGIYSSEGVFLPVKFEHGQWMILETKN